MKINKYILDVCMWSQNGHAPCYKLQKGRFYHNKTQQRTRFNNLLTIICTDVAIEQKLLTTTGEAFHY